MVSQYLFKNLRRPEFKSVGIFFLLVHISVDYQDAGIFRSLYFNRALYFATNVPTYFTEPRPIRI